MVRIIHMKTNRLEEENATALRLFENLDDPFQVWMSHGDQVSKLAHLQPVICFYNLTLNQRNGCISTAKTEQSNLKKSPEKSQINHFSSFLLSVLTL